VHTIPSWPNERQTLLAQSESIEHAAPKAAPPPPESVGPASSDIDASSPEPPPPSLYGPGPESELGFDAASGFTRASVFADAALDELSLKLEEKLKEYDRRIKHGD
jgi:hypothetical protein